MNFKRKNRVLYKTYLGLIFNFVRITSNFSKILQTKAKWLMILSSSSFISKSIFTRFKKFFRAFRKSAMLEILLDIQNRGFQLRRWKHDKNHLKKKLKPTPKNIHTYINTTGIKKPPKKLQIKKAYIHVKNNISSSKTVYTHNI